MKRLLFILLLFASFQTYAEIVTPDGRAIGTVGWNGFGNAATDTYRATCPLGFNNAWVVVKDTLPVKSPWIFVTAKQGVLTSTAFDFSDGDAYPDQLISMYIKTADYLYITVNKTTAMGTNLIFDLGPESYELKVSCMRPANGLYANPTSFTLIQNQ